MMKRLRTPFASAVAGGLVVGLLGWAAIAAGWVQGDDTTTTTTVSAPAGSTAQPAADETGKALSVNQIYTDDAPGVVYIEAKQAAQPSPFNPFGQSGGGTATGSGFVYDDQGHILTNEHVVAGADQVTVRVGGEDGDTYDAKVVGEDKSTDVAVLQVSDGVDQLQPLELGDSADVKVGDPVVAIGNPYGLDRSATAGIVSAVQREINAPNGFTITNAIQTDAPINPGNSGGPLLDAEGKVIGITSQIESGGGSEGNVGIGFAVPIDTVREIAQQLISDGEVQHAFLGISGGDLTPEVADVLNLDVDHGAIVQSVVPDSPADKAGIEAGDATVNVGGQRIRAGGDVITAVDGNEVSGMDDVITAVDSKNPGDSLALTLLRGGQERTVSVELADRPAQARG
ncbi:MAG TPA: trypsin-like peptidase domain-containing protein [Solirubrobacterales bacterium]|nr:trypsin-like peptidase domain-containing protein [Solirubrobacterales bacterium]